MPTFRRPDLRDAGASDRDIIRRVDAGELHRLRPGSFTDSAELTPLERHRELIDVTLPLLGRHTVLSHHSAAVLHNLPIPDDLLYRATATRHRTTRGGGNAAPRLRTYAAPFTDADLVEIDGIRVTSISRTAADLARVLDRADAIRLLDAALHWPQGVGELPGRRDEIADHLRRARRCNGVDAAERHLARADGRAESVLETDSRLLFRDQGLPEPVLQLVLCDESGAFVARCDFGWPELGLVGEADGVSKYQRLLRPGESPADAVVREKIREDQVRSLGWMMKRWTTAETRTPRRLAAGVRAAFDAGRVPTIRGSWHAAQGGPFASIGELAS